MVKEYNVEQYLSESGYPLPFARETVTNGVPNLAVVEGTIRRGGQPTPGGWKYLKSIGITDVIKLNTVDEASDLMALNMGIKIHYHPINGFQQIVCGPNEKDIELALSEIKDNTFIHCEHGKDRTGLLVGIYRLRNGWAKEKAWAEMINYGFHPVLLGLSACWLKQVTK